jgi:hypothetical protein
MREESPVAAAGIGGRSEALVASGTTLGESWHPRRTVSLGYLRALISRCKPRTATDLQPHDSVFYGVLGVPWGVAFNACAEP